MRHELCPDCGHAAEAHDGAGGPRCSLTDTGVAQAHPPPGPAGQERRHHHMSAVSPPPRPREGRLPRWTQQELTRLRREVRALGHYDPELVPRPATFALRAADPKISGGVAQAAGLRVT